jgi:hypothetical protein
MLSRRTLRCLPDVNKTKKTTHSNEFSKAGRTGSGEKRTRGPSPLGATLAETFTALSSTRHCVIDGSVVEKTVVVVVVVVEKQKRFVVGMKKGKEEG